MILQYSLVIDQHTRRNITLMHRDSDTLNRYSRPDHPGNAHIAKDLINTAKVVRNSVSGYSFDWVKKSKNRITSTVIIQEIVKCMNRLSASQPVSDPDRFHLKDENHYSMLKISV